MIRAVVFDLDNTLYDYDFCNKCAESMLYLKFNDYFGLTRSESETILIEAKKIVKNRLGPTAASHNRLLYMQTVCELLEKNPLIYAKKLYHCYWNEILNSMQTYEYVIPLLTLIRGKQIKIAILTDLTAYIQYSKLEKLGIIQYIDYIVTSEEAGDEKPSEKIFNLVFQKIGCSPQEILMVGDSYEKDILGAERMGMTAIQYYRGRDMINEVRRYI